jgi:hypothetical protein
MGTHPLYSFGSAILTLNIYIHGSLTYRVLAVKIILSLIFD